ncbi:MAG: DUF6252 family protein [Bacteroidia bacterium]|nr:DUF6252 family protein [Bacteroidia bacterium]
MKRLLVVLLVIIVTLPACTEDETAATPGAEFDTNLMGYWYRTGKPTSTTSVRPVYHHVFHISSDGSHHTYGVEIATGKIAPLSEKRGVKILFANNGRIGIFWFKPPEAAWDTLDYQVDWNVLSISGNSPISGVWTRKTAGQRVTDPLHAEFSCRIDGIERRIPAVARQVGAYVSWKPSLTMDAWIMGVGTSANVSIHIPEFTGPGSYSLANANAQYHIFDDDIVTSYITDAQHSGTITIESFDSAARQITGSFEFTARRYRDTGNPPERITITNGRFSVPTYP